MSFEKQWFIYTKKADFAGIAERFHLSPVTARILRNRDVFTDEDIRKFLYGNLTDLNPSSMLPDAGAAADCIVRKIREEKPIRIVGDYDIDGVCATFILYDSLNKAGAKVDYRIPERIRDGYGINMRIVEEAIRDGIDTLITCDNGIAAFEELGLAKEKGLTVILTDHHDIRFDEEGKELLPPADCIINAKRKDSLYPEKEICGAVTAWKVVELVFEKLSIPKTEWERYLEFAGIATIGDVMKLCGENRIIAKEALKRMNENPVNEGLKALIRETGLEGKRIGCYHIGFVIGPCINAGGRLETAEEAMKLFLAREKESALVNAEVLRKLNDERKDMTQKGVERACAFVEEKLLDAPVLVICLPDLHESMAGIVAGKVKEQYNRPCFVLTKTEGMPGILKGSGRSIEAWNMFEGLQKTKELLYRFGGHPMAAGISIEEGKLEEFTKRINETCGLSKADLVKKIWIDMQLPFRFVTKELIREIEELEPFGNGNAKPLFALKDVKAANFKVMGKNRNVLKMDLYSEDGCRLPGLMFGEADRILEELTEKEKLNITYHPQLNEYLGSETVQVQIEDFC